MAESAFATAYDRRNVRVYFYVADDDPERERYLHIEGCSGYRGPDWPIVQATNFLAAQEVMDNKNLFVLAGDDAVFATPHWDKALIEAYQALDNKIHVFSLLDSRDADGYPHPIITREYIEAMGYMVPPIFLHWYVDTWTVEIAKANNCFTHLKEYLLIHDKPSDDGKKDITHDRLRRIGWHVRDTAVDKECRHFLEVEKKRLAAAIKALNEERIEIIHAMLA